MDWIFISIVTAGLVSGFLAGASPSATGGGLASMVGGVIVGAIAGVSQSSKIDAVLVNNIGWLFFIYQLSLIGAYVSGNILRKHGLLVWMGIQKPR